MNSENKRSGHLVVTRIWLLTVLAFGIIAISALTAYFRYYTSQKVAYQCIENSAKINSTENLTQFEVRRACFGKKNIATIDGNPITVNQLANTLIGIYDVHERSKGSEDVALVWLNDNFDTSTKEQMYYYLLAVFKSVDDDRIGYAMEKNGYYDYAKQIAHNTPTSVYQTFHRGLLESFGPSIEERIGFLLSIYSNQSIDESGSLVEKNDSRQSWLGMGKKDFELLTIQIYETYGFDITKEQNQQFVMPVQRKYFSDQKAVLKSEWYSNQNISERKWSEFLAKSFYTTKDIRNEMRTKLVFEFLITLAGASVLWLVAFVMTLRNSQSEDDIVYESFPQAPSHNVPTNDSPQTPGYQHKIIA